MRCLCLDKKISYLYEENHLLKEIREQTLNIGCILKEFTTKFKCSIDSLYKSSDS